MPHVAEDTVTIVMPAYNAADVLHRAVTSVLGQTYADWQLVIVNDGSTDETPAIAIQFAKTDPRIRVLDLAHNQGAAHARNVAIRTATGRYIAFLDVDDEWEPEKLTTQIAWMKAYDIPFSFTAYQRGESNDWRYVSAPERVDHATLLRGNVIGCLTVVYDQIALGRVEMPDMKIRQDYALWLKLLRLTPYAYGLDTPLAKYHRVRKSLSSNLWHANLATLRLYRGQEGLSWPGAVYCLSSHLAKRSMRHFGTRKNRVL